MSDKPRKILVAISKQKAIYTYKLHYAGFVTLSEFVLLCLLCFAPLMTKHVGPCLVPSYVRSWIGPAVIKEGLVPRDFDRWSTLSALPISSHCLDFNDLDDYEEEDRLKLELEARRGVSQDTLLKDVIPIDRHRNSEWMDLLVIIPNMHMGEPQSEPTSAPVPDLNPVASLLPNHKRVAVNPSRDRVVPKRLREVTPEQDPDCPTLPVKHHQLDEMTVGCKNCDACKHEMHYWKLTGKERLMRLILSPHLPTPNSCMPTIEDFLSHRYIDLTYLQELYYTSFEGYPPDVQHPDSTRFATFTRAGQWLAQLLEHCPEHMALDIRYYRSAFPDKSTLPTFPPLASLTMRFNDLNIHDFRQITGRSTTTLRSLSFYVWDGGINTDDAQQLLTMLGNTLEELALGFCERDGKKSQLRDPDHVVALLDPLKRLQHLFLSSEVNVAWPASLANAMAIKCRINKATIKRITIGSIKAGKKHLWDQLLNGCFPNLEYLGLEGRSLKTLVKRLKLEYAPVVIELVQFEDYRMRGEETIVKAAPQVKYRYPNRSKTKRLKRED